MTKAILGCFTPRTLRDIYSKCWRLALYVAALSVVLFSNVQTFAQQVSLDWKIEDAGEVRQLVTNMGTLWPAGGKNYPGLINCEFPPGSFEEHIGEAGIWVGGITPDGDTLVSVTTSWNPWASHYNFYPPTSEPWDTIWVVTRGKVANIPYWPNYVASSDMDLVCRYNDYNPVSMKDPWHKPLYVDVIQVVRAWASPEPLNQIVLFDFYVIPAKFNLRSVYMTWWADPNVGYRLSDIQLILRDDYSLYFPSLHMGVGVDAPGGPDGTAYSPIGFMVIPPKGVPPNKLTWTFIWGPQPNPPGIVPALPQDKYRQLMSSGVIMQNQAVPTGSHFVISFGPFDLNTGDTLHFQVAEILGKGLDGVVNNAKFVQNLALHDFKVPAAPPSPSLKATTSNHSVTLSWEPSAENNPETYTDPNRADSSQHPFEGYRVYKSTVSAQGPWILLAEYDEPNDPFGHNIGIKHSYTDDGLLNNFTYYYSVTSFSKPDTVLPWPSLESNLNQNVIAVVPGPAPPPDVGKVKVVPNPYRGDVNYYSFNPRWETPPPSRSFWMEQDRKIQFINLPQRCEIKIYTLAGTLVQTIEHDNAAYGYEDWNLTSMVGQAVSSGIYLFTVKNLNTGSVQVGNFVIIK